MPEDPSCDHKVPHGSDWVIVAPVAAFLLKNAHQRFVRQSFKHDLQPFQIP
jgi:hypothetical protein